MKNKILLLLTILLLVPIPNKAIADEMAYIPDISMQISSNLIVADNQTIELDEEAVLKDGRSYFPLRGLAEFYKIDVGFIEESQTVVLKDSYLEAKLSIGSGEMIVSYGDHPLPSRIIKLDAPAYISQNGRTMLPIRAVAEEVFGCDVYWDENEKKITLSKNYQSKRIIAKSVSDDYEYNISSATVKDGGLKNVSFLDFPNETPDGVIRYYCQLLASSDDIVYAEPDVVLQVQLS